MAVDVLAEVPLTGLSFPVHWVIGYANFLRLEGTHEPILHCALFDHGPAMTARWRRYLRDTYETVDRLRAAPRAGAAWQAAEPLAADPGRES